MICPSGHVQPDGARFCGVCGARTSLGQAGPAGDVPADRTTVGTTVVIVAVIAVLAVVVGAAAGWLLTSRDDAVDTTGGDGADTTTTVASVTTSTAPRAEPPSTPSTPAPTTTSTTRLEPTRVPPPGPITSEGEWIAALASMDEEDPAGVQQKFDELEAQYGPVSSMRTSEYASLTPGFVVIYRGPFRSGDDALSECFRLGRTTRHLCFAAPLTQSTADRNERRYPD